MVMRKHAVVRNWLWQQFRPFQTYGLKTRYLVWTAETVRKSVYKQRFHEDLHHEQPLHEKKKRNTWYYSSTRRIVTCTGRKVVDILQHKMGLTLSMGTVWAYKPFYIANPSEKEKQLCLCKLCLNKRLLFQALRKNYSEMGDSLSGYLMGSCDCSKHENGFWKMSCSKGLCKSCKTKRNTRTQLPELDTETKKNYVLSV